MNRKVWKLVTAAAVLCTITACTKTQETQENETQEETETLQTPEETVGAWEVYEYADGRNTTDDDLQHFADAMEGLTGVGYEPAGVLATQIVSGQNTAFLARGTQLSTDTLPELYIVTVYTDTKGHSSVLAINRIELSEIRTGTLPEDVAGGWEVTGSGRPGALGEDGEAALSEALEGLDGMQYMPVTLLGTQLVSGMNYRYLCYGTTVTETPETGLYIVDVYAPLEGKAEISDIQPFDLLYYVTPQE